MTRRQACSQTRPSCFQVKGKKRQSGWFPASYVKVLGGSGANSSRSSPVPTAFASSTQGEQVRALFPFVAQHEDELSFQKGQVVTVLSKEDPSWWKGELAGHVGLFPSNYVEPLDRADKCECLFPLPHCSPDFGEH